MAFVTSSPLMPAKLHRIEKAVHNRIVTKATLTPSRLARFSRADDFKIPHTIPAEGLDRVVELVKNGTVNRYLLPADQSDASLSEVEIAKRMNFKYAIGVNSCTSAMVLALRCVGVTTGTKVLTNAFTFTALPSCILACNAEPVLVEATKDFHMCVDDLRKKIIANPDAKVVLLSHFRGRVSDCDAIRNLCDEYGIILIEDCAHCLGVKYKGVAAGRRAHIAAISVQSEKIINAGEGGYVVTDNEEWASNMLFMSGGYERRSLKAHLAVPLHAEKVMENAMLTNPNFSFRMTNVTGALVLAQLPLLEDRIAKWNMISETLVEGLQSVIEKGIIEMPQHAEGVEGVVDHFVFRTPGFNSLQREYFNRMCNEYGAQVRYLGTDDNARFFKNWNYLTPDMRQGLEKTAAIVEESWDIKLPLAFEKSDVVELADLMTECCMQAVSYNGN